MNRATNRTFSTVFIAAFALSACSNGSDDVRSSPVRPVAKTAVAATNPAVAQPSASPGKITAPISFDYTIIGNPLVGQAIRVNLQISSPLDDRAITMHYRVNDAGSLTFPETQLLTTSLLPLPGATVRSQQVTVVPQREGRLYLVVSAEIETDNGSMMRSMSIPIQVGRAPRASTLNGELVEGVEGEKGISMPAKEP